MNIKVSFLVCSVFCGSAMADAAHSPQSILSAIDAAGIKIANAVEEVPNPNSPLPKSFDSNWSFEDVDLNTGSGGQFFICSKPKYCEAIFLYFDALKALAGPYLYQSKDGLVVFQLNSGLSVQQAEKYESVINAL